MTPLIIMSNHWMMKSFPIQIIIIIIINILECQRFDHAMHWQQVSVYSDLFLIFESSQKNRSWKNSLHLTLMTHDSDWQFNTYNSSHYNGTTIHNKWNHQAMDNDAYGGYLLCRCIQNPYPIVQVIDTHKYQTPLVNILIFDWV